MVALVTLVLRFHQILDHYRWHLLAVLALALALALSAVLAREALAPLVLALAMATVMALAPLVVAAREALAPLVFDACELFVDLSPGMEEHLGICGLI